MSERIRILFIGEMHSSHARSWVELLSPFKNEFEIQGLHVSPVPLPVMNFPIFDVNDIYIESDGRSKLGLGRKYIDKEELLRSVGYVHGFGNYNKLQLYNAMRVLQLFRPHIIHTLGIYPSSAFFLKVLSLYFKLGSWSAWIVQARGGPDIALNRKSPDLAPEIKLILNYCHCFIADNQQNYDFALEMGLAPDKLSITGPVPGTGGIETLFFKDVPLPSKKERLILWPKAYNCIQSDGMVVLEALRLALPRIGNFRLIATAADPDVEYWFNDMLGIYGERVEIHKRLSREQLLEIYRTARVLLAPSLSDGVPNTMYEAMASQTVPILSPIETLLPLFADKVHTIYAPNLDPAAIAEALVTAMNDDVLADKIAMTNRARLPSLAGRDAVRDRVVTMYRQVIKAHQFPPIVSVIIPAFNRRKYIGEAIQSVLDQTFRDFEIMVNDDGSTDGTADVVKSFSDDRVKYISQANRGRSNARNHAIDIATGQYIAFLDSDDLYLPGKLELQVSYLDKHPEVGMVYTSAYCMNEENTLLSDSYRANKSGWIYKDIAFYVPVTITLPTVMVRREVLDRVGGFDEKMERFEDTDMWRRIAKEFPIGAIPDFTCKLRTHGGNALAGQDPRKIEAAITYYIDKIFSEDSSMDLDVRRKGASGLCFFYARALLTMSSSAASGRRLLLKSIGYAPGTICKLMFLGHYFIRRLYNKIEDTTTSR